MPQKQKRTREIKFARLTNNPKQNSGGGEIKLPQRTRGGKRAIGAGIASLAMGSSLVIHFFLELFKLPTARGTRMRGIHEAQDARNQNLGKPSNRQRSIPLTFFNFIYSMPYARKRLQAVERAGAKISSNWDAAPGTLSKE